MAVFFELPDELRLLRGEAITRLTDTEFFQFCQESPLQRFERDADHNIILMSSSYPNTSEDGLGIGYQLMGWNRPTRLGHTYESSAGFKLPNGAVRAPDAAWMSRARRAAAKPAGGFLAACPQFVVEVKSSSDRLATRQVKLEEYLTNGVLLGFLLDVATEAAYLCRPGQPVETAQAYDRELSGEPVLPSFQLNLRPLRRQ